MENKNLLLAIVISVVFLFLWTTFVVPRFSPVPVTPTVAGAPKDSTRSELSKVAAEIVPANAVSATQHLPAEARLRDEQNEILFTPRGGAVVNWKLKLKGQEFDLVQSSTNATLPLSTFPDKEFRLSQRDRQEVMTATLEGGVRLTKTLVLSADGFLHDFTLRFDNTSSTAVEVKNWTWGWGPGLGTVDSELKENASQTRALSVNKIKAHKLKVGDSPQCGRWCGVDNRYFLFAIVPPADHQPRLQVIGEKEQTQVVLHETVTVPARGMTVLHYRVYAGPKGYIHLKKYEQGLEEGVDFGFFGSLGKLILQALYKLQEWTGNYGWAIVLLTMGLQVMLLPLTLKSFKATMAMKRLQPQVAALQQKYKGDPKRLNIETMNLYKNSKTNPFGGCLPMLLQLPIFWALFTTLRNAYELRGAPWVGWVTDLSAADPYRVLPIVMGASMFLQQRMAGAVSDPMQRQMMYMMPVIFTLMFLNFPSGLVLYWLTNNVLTIAFQYAFQQTQNKRIEIIPPR